MPLVPILSQCRGHGSTVRQRRPGNGIILAAVLLLGPSSLGRVPDHSRIHSRSSVVGCLLNGNLPLPNSINTVISVVSGCRAGLGGAETWGPKPRDNSDNPECWTTIRTGVSRVNARSPRAVPSQRSLSGVASDPDTLVGPAVNCLELTIGTARNLYIRIESRTHRLQVTFPACVHMRFGL